MRNRAAHESDLRDARNVKIADVLSAPAEKTLIPYGQPTRRYLLPSCGVAPRLARLGKGAENETAGRNSAIGSPLG
jgi:hypothetical protein